MDTYFFATSRTPLISRWLLIRRVDKKSVCILEITLKNAKKLYLKETKYEDDEDDRMWMTKIIEKNICLEKINAVP